jgi:hypothetical protein
MQKLILVLVLAIAAGACGGVSQEKADACFEFLDTDRFDGSSGYLINNMLRGSLDSPEDATDEEREEDFEEQFGIARDDLSQRAIEIQESLGTRPETGDAAIEKWDVEFSNEFWAYWFGEAPDAAVSICESQALENWPLSDAELVWCKENPDQVLTAGESLALSIAGEDLIMMFLVHADETARACGAAFGLRNQGS